MCICVIHSHDLYIEKSYTIQNAEVSSGLSANNRGLIKEAKERKLTINGNKNLYANLDKHTFST